MWHRDGKIHKQFLHWLGFPKQAQTKSSEGTCRTVLLNRWKRLLWGKQKWCLNWCFKIFLLPFDVISFLPVPGLNQLRSLQACFCRCSNPFSGVTKVVERFLGQRGSFLKVSEAECLKPFSSLLFWGVRVQQAWAFKDPHSESQQPPQRLLKTLCSGGPFGGTSLFRVVLFFFFFWLSCRVLAVLVKWAVLGGRHCTENKVGIVLPSGI